MRVLLLTNGSHGDVHPIIAVGRALAQRGVEAAVMTNPWFEGEIWAAGLECIAASEPVDIREFMRANPWMNNPRVAGKRLFGRVIIPALPDMLARLDAELSRRRPDVVAVHPLSLGAPAVCGARGIPWVSVSLAPSTWLSRDEACCTLPVPVWGVHPPLWLWRWMRAMSLPMLRRWIDPGVNRALAARGLPPGRDHLLLCARGGRRSLGMWPEVFRPAAADDPAGGVACGFPWFDQTEGYEPARELAEFVEGGEPPVVFSLGTATVHTPGRFYESAARALAGMGGRGVLLTGRGNPAPTGLPAGVVAAPYAPFAWLMPRAAATVHHGGIGTTAQGLRSGRPTVIVPHAHDQFDNAARAENLGVSRTLLRPTAAGLEGALRAVLGDAGVARRARELGPRVAGDGARAAAEVLIAVASGGGAVEEASTGGRELSVR